MEKSNTIHNCCRRRIYWLLTIILFLVVIQMLSKNSSPIQQKLNLTPHSQRSKPESSVNLQHNINSQDQTSYRSESRVYPNSSSSAKPEKNRLIIKTNTRLEKVIILDRSRISVELPFTSFKAELKVEATPDVVSVSIDGFAKRSLISVLGIGKHPFAVRLAYGKQRRNKSPIRFTDFEVTIIKKDREVFYVYEADDEVCYLEQDCGRILYSKRKCGLQRMHLWSPSTNVHGYWKMRCNDCSLEETCLWSKAEWIETDNTAILPPLPNADSLRTCLKDHQVLFLGDSTLREMMHTIMEKVNTTLSNADKTITLRSDYNVGMATNFTFTYFRRIVGNPPTFRQALDDLVKHCPTKGKENRTILAVGGLQWLTTSMLAQLLTFIKEKGIPSSNVYIKLFGSGYMVKADNRVAYHNEDSLLKLIRLNDELRKQAREYGFGVVDTFQMTLSRYREFHLGIASCHFHRVTPYQLNGSSPPEVDSVLKYLPNSGTAYHIDGDIHLRYTDMLIRQMCNNHDQS